MEERNLDELDIIVYAIVRLCLEPYDISRSFIFLFWPTSLNIFVRQSSNSLNNNKICKLKKIIIAKTELWF